MSNDHDHAPHELSAASQAYLLTARSIVGADQPITISALAGHMRVSKQAASEMAGRLVREGLLVEIPKTPVVANAREGDPWYRASEDRKSCEVHFNYHLKNQGFGLGDTTYAEWNSDTGKWSMRGPGYPQ